MLLFLFGCCGGISRMAIPVRFPHCLFYRLPDHVQESITKKGRGVGLFFYDAHFKPVKSPQIARLRVRAITRFCPGLPSMKSTACKTLFCMSLTLLGGLAFGCSLDPLFTRRRSPFLTIKARRAAAASAPFMLCV